MLADMRPGTVVAAYFHVTRTLGTGSFGKVVEAMDTRTRAYVAIKLEAKDAEFPQLVYEKRVMDELGHCRGFPACIWFGYDDVYNILIMERLNTSLEQLRTREGGNLPLDFLQHVGQQGLDRLHTFHTAGFAHRDIKPENFMMSKKILYLIDFGLCKRVLNPQTGAHIAHRGGKTLAGTPRYASIHAHQGHEQSRKDDLESFMYMMVFLAKGSLPWQKSLGVQFEDIGMCKERTDVDKLCSGLPACYRQTLLHARGLLFEDCPDYVYIKALWSGSAK